MSKSYVVLVSGATGFVGGAVVRRLLAEGLWNPFDQSSSVSFRPKDLRVLALGRNLEAGRAHFICANLRDGENLLAVCQPFQSIDLVINCAAKCDYWGRWEDFYGDNVTATENVIGLCLKTGAKLIQMSSPSVYASCFNSQMDVTEDFEPTEFLGYYGHTKYLADLTVQKLYHRDSIILRPRAVFGPGDRQLLPKLAEKLKQGRLPFIGSEPVHVELTFIENVLDAIWASCVLILKPFPYTGIYNITNGETISIDDVVGLLADKYLTTTPQLRIPFVVAWYLACLMEWIWTTLGLFDRPPPLTRYLVTTFGSSMKLDISKAKMHLKYEPRVSLAAGLAKTLDFEPTQ